VRLCSTSTRTSQRYSRCCFEDIRMNNTACNDSVEPGNLHSASWYRSGYCQYNAGRNRIHTCERGYPELKFYTAGYDGCVVNFQTSNQSRTCGTIFANRRIASCGTADFGGLVPLVPQNPITSTVVEVAKPEYAYYGTLEYYVGLGCNNSQLFQLNTRRVDFCDSQAARILACESTSTFPTPPAQAHTRTKITPRFVRLYWRLVFHFVP
jgi:hypothetical protein